jgi:hypothetical protein
LVFPWSTHPVDIRTELRGVYARADNKFVPYLERDSDNICDGYDDDVGSLYTFYYGASTFRADTLGVLGRRPLHFRFAIVHDGVRVTADLHLTMPQQLACAIPNSRIGNGRRVRVKDSAGDALEVYFSQRMRADTHEHEIAGFMVAYIDVSPRAATSPGPAAPVT